MTSKPKTIIKNEVAKMRRKIWVKERELEKLKEAADELEAQADEMN